MTKVFNFINKYFVYIIGLLIIVIGMFVYFTFFNNSYSNIEKRMVKFAKEYITNNNVSVTGDMYIELTELGNIKGVSSCSKSSGVIVTNNGGTVDYLPYLNCDNYKSNGLNNQNDYLQLIGDSIVLLNNKEPYNEMGYSLKSNVTIEENSNVKNTPGVYRIRYNILNNGTFADYLERIVLVSKNDKTINMNESVNERYPKLSLFGDDEMIVLYGENYNEPGYSAISSLDGDLTNNVIVKGNVDTKKAGDYYLDYSVTSSNGYRIAKRRIVRVIKKDVNFEPLISLNTNEPSQVVLINIAVNGDGYNYTILPNGEKITDSTISYKVTENGKYTFKIYDVNNDEIIKEIDVNNIDNVKPTGSCRASFLNNQVVITVDASDDQKMGDYKYFVDNKEFTSDNNIYTYSKRYYKKTVENIKVEISDKALNKTTLSCSNTVNITPVVYKDSLGYDCIEPYVCYKQIDYNDPYQATSSGVGTIYRSGCLPTSLAIAFTKYEKRSLNGNLYTPPTLIKEVIYRDGKITGYSNYGRLEEVSNLMGLKVTKIDSFTEANKEIIRKHLADDNPIVINTNGGCYSTGAHFLAIIAINEQGQVFLSDPYRRDNISMTKKCAVNTWVSLDEVIKTGGSQYFGLISE